MSNNFYKIIATEPFLLNYIEFFEKYELEKFEKFKLRLKVYPYLGDQLRVPFVREFKTESGKRAYFLVYTEIKVILFVAFSTKKNQKKIITDIFERLKEFKEFAYSMY